METVNTGKYSAPADVMGQDKPEARRKPGFFLWLGLLFAPAIFVWFVLFRRYAISTKIFACISAGLQVGLFTASMAVAPSLLKQVDATRNEIKELVQLSRQLTQSSDVASPTSSIEEAAPVLSAPTSSRSVATIPADVIDHIARYCPQKAQDGSTSVSVCEESEKQAYLQLADRKFSQEAWDTWGRCMKKAKERSYEQSLACMPENN